MPELKESAKFSIYSLAKQLNESRAEKDRFSELNNFNYNQLFTDYGDDANKKKLIQDFAKSLIPKEGEDDPHQGLESRQLRERPWKLGFWNEKFELEAKKESDGGGRRRKSRRKKRRKNRRTKRKSRKRKSRKRTKRRRKSRRKKKNKKRY